MIWVLATTNKCLQSIWTLHRLGLKAVCVAYSVTVQVLECRPNLQQMQNKCTFAYSSVVTLTKQQNIFFKKTNLKKQPENITETNILQQKIKTKIKDHLKKTQKH